MPINRDELRKSLQTSLPVTEEGVLKDSISPSHRVAIGNVYRLLKEYAEDFSRFLTDCGVPADPQAITNITTAYQNIVTLLNRQCSLKFEGDSIRFKDLPFRSSFIESMASLLLAPPKRDGLPSIWLPEEIARKALAMDLLLCQIELRDALISALPLIIDPSFSAELKSFANDGTGDASSLLSRVRDIVDKAVFIHPGVQDAIISVNDGSKLDDQRLAVALFLDCVRRTKESEDNS